MAIAADYANYINGYYTTVPRPRGLAGIPGVDTLITHMELIYSSTMIGALIDVEIALEGSGNNVSTLRDVYLNSIVGRALISHNYNPTTKRIF